MHARPAHAVGEKTRSIVGPHFWRAFGQYKPSNGFHCTENKIPAPHHGMQRALYDQAPAYLSDGIFSLLSNNTSLLF